MFLEKIMEMIFQTWENNGNYKELHQRNDGKATSFELLIFIDRIAPQSREIMHLVVSVCPLMAEPFNLRP